jgi:enoyl-CoA hydratase/carnithine racemase
VAAAAGLLDAAAGAPAARVLVLTGAGETFCAGADIAGAEELVRGDTTVAAEEAMAAFPKPTIARIRGHCVGGGCQLAVACDLRLALDDARFGVPPAKLGVAYPAPTTRRLVALIGPAKAKRRGSGRRAGSPPTWSTRCSRWPVSTRGSRRWSPPSPAAPP